MATLRLTTFNIQHGRNHNLQGDIIDLPLMASTAKSTGASVFGFNEVRCGLTDGIPGFPDAPGVFASLLDGKAVFGKAIELGEGKHYGNLLVSKLPVLDSEVITIPDPVTRTGNRLYETRCIIRAVLDCEGKPVTLLCSHFGLNDDEHGFAVATVLRLIENDKNPVVLMGDFNMTPDDAHYALIAERMTDCAVFCGSDEYTFSSDNPRERIDYIFVRGTKVKECHTVRVIASDHFPVTAEIEI